jgi:SAM-dependent methyltransferase
MTEPPTPTQVLDWESRYRDGTARWERGVVNPALTGFLADGTLSPGRILVPGAGRSPEPLVLARAGFAVVTVDVSPSAVAAQQEQLAGTSGRAELADLFTWQPEQKLDAIYDQACLCALPPALLPDYAARLAEWLRPGGVLVELFLQRDSDGGPPFHCDIARMRELFPDRLWAWPAVIAAPSPASPAGFSEIPTALRRR